MICDAVCITKFANASNSAFEVALAVVAHWLEPFRERWTEASMLDGDFPVAALPVAAAPLPLPAPSDTALPPIELVISIDKAFQSFSRYFIAESGD